MIKFLKYPLILAICSIIGAASLFAQQLKSHEEYIDVKGGEIWYRVLGEGDNIPLLILHGGPGGTSRSLYLFSPLANERPVILFDQLGGGRSTYHTDTSLLKVPYFVDQVHAVTEALALDSVYILGHSWGTALALEYYLKHPGKVAALVFNSPYFSTPVWEADADTLISSLPQEIHRAIADAEASENFKSPEYQHANQVFLSQYGLRTKRLVSELDTATYAGNNFIYNYMWGPTEFTATGTLKHYHRVDQLHRIHVPVLFITGEYDEARPETVRYFQSKVTGAQMEVIEGAGHATMHDNLPANIKALRDFLHGIEENERN